MTTFFEYPSEEKQQALTRTINLLLAPGKGILEADASADIMGLRFVDIGIDNTAENRRLYRELLFSSDAEISNYISGVTMNMETLRQESSDGRLLISLLKERSILYGIKVYKGLVPLMGSRNEYTTQGLDDLGRRLKKLKMLDVRFVKWRCVYKITEFTPSIQALVENSNTLARFAATCQDYEIVPLVQAEVLPDGTHNIYRCQRVMEAMLAHLFRALNDHHVLLEGMLLKTNMITPGEESRECKTDIDVAKITYQSLLRTVPVAVPGILFASGNQNEVRATVRLNCINLEAGEKKPWVMSFAYGRSLHLPVFYKWMGDPQYVPHAQFILIARAKANGEAAEGVYNINKNDPSESPLIKEHRTEDGGKSKNLNSAIGRLSVDKRLFSYKHLMEILEKEFTSAFMNTAYK